MEAIKNEDGTWDIPQLEHWEETFETMCLDITTGRPFKFARYGDGEFFCMNGRQGHNCDGHEYFPELGKRLKKAALRADHYMVGIQPLSISQKINLHEYFADAQYYNADVLHNASIKGRLWQFYDRAFETKSVVLVGPKHLLDLSKRTGSPKSFIEISPLNCWTEYFKTCQSIATALRGINNPIVLLCASMMSEVIIDQFRHHEDLTIIDCGSVFDPYCHVKSRRYHQTLQV